jgi:hypothetical protein
MTDTQLYLTIGVPTMALVLGMIGNGLLFNVLSARITSLEARMLALETRMHTFETSVNQRIDLLIGKIGEIGTRLGI